MADIGKSPAPAPARWLGLGRQGVSRPGLVRRQAATALVWWGDRTVGTVFELAVIPAIGHSPAAISAEGWLITEAGS